MNHTQPSSQPKNSAKLIAYSTLILGVIFIGFSAIFVRLANTSGIVSAFYRMAIASLLFTPFMIIHWRRGKARIPRHALGLAILGGVAFATDIAIWNTSINLTSAAIATLLVDTAPLWVGLGAWLLLKEKLSRRYWLGLLVTLSGVILIIGVDAVLSLGTNLGNILALCAGLTYATYQLLTKRVREEVDNVSYFWLFTVTGAIVLLVINLILGTPLADLQPESYMALLGLAIITHLGGWLLINYAYAELPAALISVMLLGQPVVTALVALPVLGEIPNQWHILGGLIALLGIYIVHRSFNSGAG